MMDRDVYVNERLGADMNPNFVSVKVQIDRTDSDNVQVRNWYTDADVIKKEYQVTGLPSLLFFTPDGQLVLNELGYHTLKQFRGLITLACDPQKELYYPQYQAYKQGKKDYATLEGLAMFTKKIIRDDSTADLMAKDVKENYLDKLPEDSLCGKVHLDFINNFSELISSKDHFFDLFYNQPDKVRMVTGSGGMAPYIVRLIVTREELQNKLEFGHKPLAEAPDWDKCRSIIADKYPKVNARKLVLVYQLYYYTTINTNWRKWADCKDKDIKENPAKQPYGLDVFLRFNQGGAWLAFMQCNDKKVLRKAVKWIDLAIHLDGGKDDNGKYMAYRDTKANLLYKLGKREEAMALEKEALDDGLADNPKWDGGDYKITIEHMKNFEPTNVVDGERHAVWADNTLPKKTN
jgi:thioredoxin-related protein